MKTKCICISGKAQHGKDTAASIIEVALKSYNKRVVVMHYADLLKFICKQYFGWDGKKDEIGRTLLQQVGTETVRKQSPDYWVNFIADVITFFHDKWDYVIIPDCRFPNEVNVLKERGITTTTLRVVRPDFDNGLTEEQKSHPSECALDDFQFDYTIGNTDYDTYVLRLVKYVNEMLLAE